MRYVAKQPREGINVSKTHPLAEASMLVIGLITIFIAIALALVFLVEISLHYVSSEKEAELFANWMPEDLITVSPDDERMAELQNLVDRLVAHWPDSPYKFRAEISDTELSNAMALPGGLIVVTNGLLNQVESENELAFVLGHELGHFKNRDHLRALGRGVALSLFFVVITGDNVNGLGLKVADLTLRGFGRRQESKADEFGLGIVNSEYGHVNEASRLFERWDNESGNYLDFVTYLSTHPESGKRIISMRDYAATKGWRGDGEVTSIDWVTSIDSTSLQDATVEAP